MSKKAETKKKPRASRATKEKKIAKTKGEEKKAEKVKIEPRKIVSKPSPIVSPALRSHKSRRGRGFSTSELMAVGLNPPRARRLGLRVDMRRDTKHQENIESLNEWLKASGGATRSRKLPRRSEAKFSA